MIQSYFGIFPHHANERGHQQYLLGCGRKRYDIFTNVVVQINRYEFVELVRRILLKISRVKGYKVILVQHSDW